MKKPSNFNMKSFGTILMTLSVIIIFLSGCKKEKYSGVLVGDLILGTGFVNDDPDFTINEAFCYVFIDDDTDITNGYKFRLTIDIINVTPGTTSIPYEINIADLDPGSYYLSAVYDYGVEGTPDGTDPEAPVKWEARGWFGSTTTRAPEGPNVTDFSGDHDITLYKWLV